MGSLQLPTLKGLWSLFVKSLALEMGLLESLVNGQAGEFP